MFVYRRSLLPLPIAQDFGLPLFCSPLPISHSSFHITVLSCTYRPQQRESEKEIQRGLFLSEHAALCFALRLGDTTVFFIGLPSYTHTHTHTHTHAHAHVRSGLAPMYFFCLLIRWGTLWFCRSLMERVTTHTLLCLEVKHGVNNYIHPISSFILTSMKPRRPEKYQHLTEEKTLASEKQWSLQIPVSEWFRRPAAGWGAGTCRDCGYCFVNCCLSCFLLSSDCGACNSDYQTQNPQRDRGNTKRQASFFSF